MNSKQKTYIVENYPKESLLWDEPMKGHTSFKIGGPADLFFIPESVEDLEAMLLYCRDEAIPFYIMGNGSNLLVGDRGFRGVVIQIAGNLSGVTVKGNQVTAEAGVLLSKLASFIHKAGLEGFEFASGIPGTLGGAVYMNAGAYGGEMKDVLIRAKVLTRDGEIKEIQNADLDLGYRHSVLMKAGDLVLTATLQFRLGDKEAIRAKMTDLNQRRKEKQPVEKASAGSTFKRPEGYFAGKLIMDAGLRGCQIGGAQVSEKHCGFVINTGDATAADVMALIKHIKEEVKKQFNVELEAEVRMIGEF